MFLAKKIALAAAVAIPALMTAALSQGGELDRTQDSQWLKQQAGVYDFGDKGIFIVDDAGEIFKLDAGQPTATGLWVTHPQQVIVIDTDGNRVGMLTRQDGQVQLQLADGTSASGVFNPSNGSSSDDGSDNASNDGSDNIVTETRLHPKVGTYDFGDKGKFVVAPNGKVFQVQDDGQLADTGTRMDTIGRVLSANGEVLGQLSIESGVPVYTSGDETMRGERVSATYGDITTMAGSGVPSGIKVKIGGRDVTYYAFDFNHPYAGVYQFGDEQYQVEKRTGRIWHYDSNAHKFVQEDLMVDMAGQIVDLNTNQVIGSVRPKAETGREVILTIGDQTTTGLWGSPAAGDFAKFIEHRSRSFAEFIQPALERFGDGQALQSDLIN